MSYGSRMNLAVNEFPSNDIGDDVCLVSPLLRAGLVEARPRELGGGYRVRGFPMAWCTSIAEALRIAHILLRAGRVSDETPH
jgi:hypothetical protein